MTTTQFFYPEKTFTIVYLIQALAFALVLVWSLRSLPVLSWAWFALIGGVVGTVVNGYNGLAWGTFWLNDSSSVFELTTDKQALVHLLNWSPAVAVVSVALALVLATRRGSQTQNA